MRGVFRGMPARLAIVYWLATACSQDPQFIEKDIPPGSAGSDDLIVNFCASQADADDSLREKCSSLESQLFIEPSRVELKVGESADLRAYLITKSGRKVEISSQAVWSVSHQKSVELASAVGGIKGVAPGSTVVSAKFSKFSADADVNVYVENVIKQPQVVLKIQNRDIENLTVPIGYNALVSWDAKDVDQCRVMIGDREIDRRSSGQLEVKIQESTQVAVHCRDGEGDLVSDQIEIVATRPKVQLTVNDSPSDLVLSGAGPVNVAWSSSNADSCDIAVSGQKLRVGAAGSGSLIANVQRTVEIQAECRDIQGNVDADSVVVKLEFQRKITFSPGYFDVIAGNKTRRPVSIMFALDVTGSMSGQIQTVKNGVQDFVNQLYARGFEPRIGVVPFRDSVPETGPTTEVPEGRLELTSNVEEVIRFVSGLKATNGGDANEASLAAIRASMASLRVQETRPDAIKIIMVVTDQAGHDGTLRNCAIDPVVNQFSMLTEDEQKSFKLFYSTPAIGTACSGYSDGSRQMSDLLSKILTAEESVANRGGLIPWPFANSNLVNDVVLMLEKVNPDIDLACLNTRVKLSISGEVNYLEELKDLSGSLRQLESGANQWLARTFTAEEFEAINAGEGKLEVQQCCFSKAAARAGVFNSCLKPATDRVLAFGME